MSADGLPCRRCGTVPGNPVIIYGRDQAGALVPRTAQCRGKCPREAAASTGPARAQRARTRQRAEVSV